MKKICTCLALALVAVSVSGCGWFDRKVTANFTGYSNECVDGVAYLQFPSGVTVKYTPEGKVATCK